MPDSPIDSGRSRWRDHIRPRLAALRLDPAREDEIIEEMSQHLDERYDELRRSGATENEARRSAVDELLDLDAMANGMRGLRQTLSSPPPAVGAPSASLLDELRRDVRAAIRAFAKERLFSAAALLTLALGIGGTIAMFSVVYGVLLKPLPYQDPDRLVRIVHVIGGIRQPYFSDAIFQAYVENSRTFADVGVWIPASTATITGQGDPEEVRAFIASRSVLTTLGVSPSLGRWFSTVEDSPTGPAAVMLSHGYWQRQLAGGPPPTPRCCRAASPSTDVRTRSSASCRRTSASTKTSTSSGHSASTPRRRRGSFDSSEWRN